jgi:hypothetical protein
LVAKEANQSHIEFLRKVDREARRGPNRCDHGNADHEDLLQQFKAGTPRYEQEPITHRHSISKKFGSDQLPTALWRPIAAFAMSSEYLY